MSMLTKVVTGVVLSAVMVGSALAKGSVSVYIQPKQPNQLAINVLITALEDNVTIRKVVVNRGYDCVPVYPNSVPVTLHYGQVLRYPVVKCHPIGVDVDTDKGAWRFE